MHSSSAEEACISNTGSISNGGCNGLKACYANEGDIGEAACFSQEKTIEEGFEATDSEEEEDYPGACMFNTATIGSSSCKLFGACYGNSASIGGRSCYDDYSCMVNEGPIGSDSWYVSFYLYCLLRTIE